MILQTLPALPIVPADRKHRSRHRNRAFLSPSSPLLNYTVGTSPIPLQVSTTGTITIIVNNPGGYSDQPAGDYVTIASIVFDFGAIGADASDLTNQDGSSWQVASPDGWDAPIVSGLVFTFTPPSDAANIFPNKGLTFGFTEIPINASVGTVVLTISETASTPGDPAQPDTYPPIPTQLGITNSLIGKFPVDFSLSPPAAQPPNVNAGDSTTISWSGTVSAAYSLSFGTHTLGIHADGKLFAADDHYPNLAHGDPPFALESPTTFTLTVTYTPPGRGDTAIIQAQVTVGVNFPNPSVTSFTVAPDIMVPNMEPTQVILNWATQNAGPESPVSFSVDPPLSDAEVKLNLDNDLFNTAHVAASAGGFIFTQGHAITLTVNGQSGTQSATQSARLIGCTPTAWVTDAPQAISGVGFTPDGKYMLVAGQALGAGWSVYQVGSGDPGTWPVASIGSALLFCGVAITPDGKYAFSGVPIQMPGIPASLAVIAIDETQPASQWSLSFTPLPFPSMFTDGGDVAVTPDGKFAIVVDPTGVAAVSISAGTEPANWTSTSLLPGTGQNWDGSVAISPDGKFAFVSMNGETGVFAIDESTTPDKWAMSILSQVFDDIVVTLDSKYAIAVNAAQNTASVITLDAGTTPANWAVSPLSVSLSSPSRISLSPDGTLAFIAPGNGASAAVVMIELSGAPAGWNSTSFGQVSTANSACVVSPDGQYVFTGDQAALQPFRIVPAAAKPATSTTAIIVRRPIIPVVRLTATDPLLDYAVSTNPIPLQVSTTGAITIIVNNPGGYSDQPAQDFVAVTSITLDFGAKGADGSDLTTVDGSSLQVTPPTGWGTPTVSGLKFVFTAPVGSGNIFPKDGLSFLFASIPVNQAVGTVTLTITEIASSPGDPAEPDLYPPQPKQARQKTKGIGKFPANFTVGDLVASPPNVPVGGGPTLSWSGTAGAAYELDFGTAQVTQHANQTLLQPTDTYPNTALGDTALALQVSTVFTLIVTYTPPGGGSPAVFQRQAAVGVNYPGPVISAFALAPRWITPGQTAPVQVTISWQSAQGAGEGPVGFALDPPLSSAEVAANVGNNFFNTPHTAGSQGTFNFLQGHRVTMTVSGQPGTQPAAQALDFVSFNLFPLFGAGVFTPMGISFTPSGRYGIIANLTDGSAAAITVIDFSPGDPSKWVIAGLLPGIFIAGAVVTPDGSSIIVAAATDLYVITIDPTTPASKWSVVTVPMMTTALMNDIAITPSGRYLFVGGILGLFVVDLGPGRPPASWTAIPVASGFNFQVLATPDGRYVVTSRMGDQGGGVMGQNVLIIEIAEGTLPFTWKHSSLNQDSVLPTGASADGRYIFVSLAGAGTVGAIDTSLSTDPSQWQIVSIVTGGLGQGAVGVGIPDNQFLLIARDGGADQQQNASFGVAQIVPGASPNTWPYLALANTDRSLGTGYLAAVTFDGRYLLPQNGPWALTPVAVTPALDGKPPQPSFGFAENPRPVTDK